MIITLGFCYIIIIIIIRFDFKVETYMVLDQMHCSRNAIALQHRHDETEILRSWRSLLVHSCSNIRGRGDCYQGVLMTEGDSFE